MRLRRNQLCPIHRSRFLLRQGSDFKESDEHGSWESVASTIPNTREDIGRSVPMLRCGS